VRWRVLVATTASVVALAGCTATSTVPSHTSAPVPSFVLSPAPIPVEALHQCPFGPARASVIPPATLASVMVNHIPHWLPVGMGLVDAFGPGSASRGGAYYADTHCREIEVWFWKSREVPSGHRLGPWTITADVQAGCSNAVLGDGRCLGYSVAVSGGQVGVQMMGIPRTEGDRVVQSIPV
jgi:hypothetical protein